MDFKEAKRKKDRGMGNEEFLDMLKKELIDAKAIAVVALQADDLTVNSYTAQDDSLQVLGLYQVGIDQTLDRMRVD